MAILAKTVSVPNSQINVEEFLNIENYKAGNFSIFLNDNSLINGWRMFIVFQRKAPSSTSNMKTFACLPVVWERAKNIISEGQLMHSFCNY